MVVVCEELEGNVPTSPLDEEAAATSASSSDTTMKATLSVAVVEKMYGVPAASVYLLSVAVSAARYSFVLSPSLNPDMVKIFVLLSVLTLVATGRQMVPYLIPAAVLTALSYS